MRCDELTRTELCERMAPRTKTWRGFNDASKQNTTNKEGVLGKEELNKVLISHEATFKAAAQRSGQR